MFLFIARLVLLSLFHCQGLSLSRPYILHFLVLASPETPTEQLLFFVYTVPGSSAKGFHPVISLFFFSKGRLDLYTCIG